MTLERIANIDKNCKREDFSYDMFDVSIWYYGGMFCIELIGGWDYEFGVPEYGFGTGFGNDFYYPGFDKSVQVTLRDIRNSTVGRKIKDAAESALARACVEFHLKHRKML